MKELTLDQLGNRETVRLNSLNSEQIIKIAIDKIQIREGFNVRQDYGEIEQLATSIHENGQMLPGRVDVLANGKFLLVDGHRRYKAIVLLKNQGHEAWFKAIVNPKATSEDDRIYQMFTTQDTKPLNAVEVAELIKRLENLGHAQKDIARKIGRTTSYVSQMLSFAGESPIIKNEVAAGNMKVSTVMKMKSAGLSQSDRVEKTQKAVKDAKESRVNGTNKKGEVAAKVSKALKDSGDTHKSNTALCKRIANAIIKDDNLKSHGSPQTIIRLVEIISEFV